VLYVFGFDRIGVALSDLYFIDPAPLPGQEGPERGVRLELRQLERGELPGSIYSAQPITVGRAIWRADLLESVAGPPGSFDRAHHHPRFREWEPSRRRFVEALSTDPIGWVRARLSDLEGFLEEMGADPGTIGPDDAAGVRAAVPEIMGTLESLLQRVRSGELGRPPTDGELVSARASWL
jgi:hypothetical protein